MKKQIILISLLMMCCIEVGYTQNNNTLKTSLQLLQKPREYKFPIDSTGFSYFGTPKFYLSNGEAVPFAINSKNIHFVDFNNDGHKDIIYQDTFRYGATILFANKNNDFIEIWSGDGALVEIEQTGSTTIYVLNHPIGCYNNTQLMELTVHNDNAIIEKCIAYHQDTEIKYFDADFEQQTISGVLRTQPILDNEEKKDPCTGELIIGNHVRIVENKMVTVIKRQGNWLLVIHEAKGASIICWIHYG